jgi:regulator of CtrA degradation
MRRLGNAPDSDEELVANLPRDAVQLIEASRDLYARIKRLEDGGLAPQASPARSLINRLERSIG